MSNALAEPLPSSPTNPPADSTPAAVSPNVIRDTGQPIPAGYHADSRWRPWLSTTGITVLAVSYAPAMALGIFDKNLTVLLVPVAGPAVHWVSIRGDCHESTGAKTSRCKVGDPLFWGWSAAQLGGAALIGLAALFPEPIFVRDGSPPPRESLAHSHRTLPTIVPVVNGSGFVGLGAYGSFLCGLANDSLASSRPPKGESNQAYDPRRPGCLSMRQLAPATAVLRRRRRSVRWACASASARRG